MNPLEKVGQQRTRVTGPGKYVCEVAWEECVEEEMTNALRIEGKAGRARGNFRRSSPIISTAESPGRI
jgi:hypothetical protein